ncbi:branched-chain amino acid ABC transporter substrate-binding protein [Neorhizobium sp. CSC1952]|uniref:branched-chain amino acid ABC transporter substrate-binding protein n=1 Tax=Neorhizobium sp. CSC1952 TaxID=2978974 RepID=UPI0025A561CB|nr:branched-chain amino acid ABC transporter substrate-binding protein [Rhizobium sp. CSC1952]WJR66670.1 branched-chain amino acid ABC transporter substrate-binding protein [Rhizobium sp. CSC1952]
MTARRFIIAGLLASFLACGTASAAVIGVVAPRSGPYASLGAQVFQGARAAAETAGDTIVEIDENCEESGGAAVARNLMDAKAVVAIGFLCVETLSTALPQLKAAQIPAISISVRSRILMEDALRNGWPFYRIAPVDGDEAEKLSETILSAWKAEPIALVEDGTIYGRELASAIRQHLEPAGITPVFTDTFRPGQEQQVALVRRLAKAGATHVFVGGDRNDMAIIARDAASESIPLTLIGGDAMRAANRPVPLRDGVLAVALPDYAALPSAAAAVAALRARNLDPDGYMLQAHAAAELAHQAILAAGRRPVAEAIGSGSFNTAIGPIAFDEHHELRENPFRLLEWRGSAFSLSHPATE